MILRHENHADVQVETIREASAIHSQRRDESGMGASDFQDGFLIHDHVTFARISYNGRVWPYGQNDHEIVLFDPPGRVGDGEPDVVNVLALVHFDVDADTGPQAGRNAALALEWEIDGEDLINTGTVVSIESEGREPTFAVVAVVTLRVIVENGDRATSVQLRLDRMIAESGLFDRRSVIELD